MITDEMERGNEASLVATDEMAPDARTTVPAPARVLNIERAEVRGLSAAEDDPDVATLGAERAQVIDDEARHALVASSILGSGVHDVM